MSYTRRELLIARMVGWATQQSEEKLTAALLAVQIAQGEPRTSHGSPDWARKWKRLARRLRAENAKLKQELLEEKEEREMYEKLYESTC